MKKTVLLYNLKGTKKGKELSMIFSYLGFRVRPVDKADYGVPIEELLAAKPASEREAAPAAKEASAPGEAPVPGETPAAKEASAPEGAPADFSDEMLIFDGASDETLNKALYLMKKQHASVDLKAVVTQTNRTWTSAQVHGEISKEHEAMKGNK